MPFEKNCSASRDSLVELATEIDGLYSKKDRKSYHISIRVWNSEKARF